MQRERDGREEWQTSGGMHEEEREKEGKRLLGDGRVIGEREKERWNRES